MCGRGDAVYYRQRWMRNLLNSSWNTLFYASDGISFLNLRFENDVNMYGIQTRFGERTERERFENDVNMYGIQTDPDNVKHERCLRMM